MRLLISPNPIKTSLINLISTIPFPYSLRSCRLDSTRRSLIPMAMAPKSTMASVDTEAGLARRFWIKFRRESIFSMYTPFVVCLASGDLKIESFRHYISQDVHFLRAFAQAYELAEECADDDDAKLGISELRKAVVEELKMHNSLVKEWGLDLAKESSINSATVKYTDFLFATASGKVEGVKGPGKLATPFEKTKIAAYTLGAMAPCMRLYAFLGKQFLELLDPKDGTHPFQKWIDNYSSEGFQASALQTEDLLDKLSVSLTGEELDVIEKLYHQAMKLEIDFFSAQPLFQLTAVPLTKGHNPAEDRLVIFSDFDLTCTIVDSSAILAEIAILTAPKSEQNQPDDQIVRMSSADLRNTWGFLSKQYTEDYEQCIESILPPKRLEGFDYKKLSVALERLSEFEKKANDRVIESGVLKGVNLEDIKRAGDHLILQDGCTNFFQRIVKNENLNANVHVLSYCWCGDLIRSAFLSAGLTELNVHANEFTFERSVSTGEIVKKVESPTDKVQEFRNILKNCNDDRKNLTIYIGDSVGDLLCLLEADIGIVIGSSSSLRRVGTQFGISFVPLFPGLVKKQKGYIGGNSSNWKALSGVLYTVDSWAEVHAFILGCCGSEMWCHPVYWTCCNHDMRCYAMLQAAIIRKYRLLDQGINTDFQVLYCIFKAIIACSIFVRMVQRSRVFSVDSMTIYECRCTNYFPISMLSMRLLSYFSHNTNVFKL